LAEEEINSQVRDLPPHIWRICHHLSGGSAATYLEDLPPIIWRICRTYLKDLPPFIWFTVEIRLTQPQVELELGLSLAIKMTYFGRNFDSAYFESSPWITSH
jgi:hypothetical protein